MISTLKGDLTRLDFDLIVNAANEQLAPGGGVCGAIFKAAGPQLVEACCQLGGCRTGQAKMTLSYKMPCKAIIHAVGPIWRGGEHQEEEYLEAAYWNSMCLAYEYMKRNRLDTLSIGFPCISTGIYGFPREIACPIAVQTVQRMMSTYPETRKINVTFVCFEEEDYLLYKKELKLR
ncbi:MAG: macro domain-containing protein [Erysipelotrichaceae bacterium]|nr:macro domain-containing protein [Erysipelotrichaceae bacterium]